MTWKNWPDDHRAVCARVEAHDCLNKMGLVHISEMTSYDILKRLLGYSTTISDGDFCTVMTIKDIETLELLAGPHGYAIYKMLEARQRRQNDE